ncbi:MAG: CBS domain-containing protein [Candidatus Kapabacteria bacterium]|jgi:CBS domain-containing protein|nr:CBS domain-containing protein [Candidatus Kapabacteria bacterium]
MPLLRRVSEIMTTNVFNVSIEDTIHDADEIMKREKIRHIPVLEGRKIVGVITDLKIREYSLRNIYDANQNFGENGFNKIIDYAKIMNPITHVIYPEDSVAKAVALMAKYKLDCLPVVDWEMNLLGILTHTDILLFTHSLLMDMQKQ